MLESILYAMFLVLIISGIVSIINFFLLKLLMPKKGGKYILLIPPDATGGDVAGLVYLLSMRFGIFGSFRNVNVTVVDCGMCDAAAEMCKILCDDSENVDMCDCNEICDIIQQHNCQNSKHEV